MKYVGILLSKLVAATTIVGAVAVVLMIVQITVDVFLLNLFSTSLPATGAIVANYYMAAISFLPVALAEKLDKHIAVDVFYNTLPPRFQKWLLMAVRLVVAIATGGAAYGFLLDAVHKYQNNSYVLELDVRVPDWPGYFMLPIGFGLWSLINLYKVAASLTGDEDMNGGRALAEFE
ncbi:MAG: TRAP transporter small permease [Alphaproteobacteria bacterium]|nr:TRAP transporter small permease [Alphaproteobacteria bacterium]